MGNPLSETSGIHLEGLVVGYDSRPVIEGVDGEFPLGSATAIIGPNGAGKSTLLKAIAGLLSPVRGKVVFQDCTMRDVAYLAQRAEIERSFPISALDMVLLGRWRDIGATRAAKQWITDACEKALETVGLAEFIHSPVSSLSIGQFQRVLFARLMVQDAQIILLDEPFAAIDAATTVDLLAIIRQWSSEGRTILAALHDLGQVRDYFPRALLLNRHVLGWGSTAEILTRTLHDHLHIDADCSGGMQRMLR